MMHLIKIILGTMAWVNLSFAAECHKLEDSVDVQFIHAIDLNTYEGSIHPEIKAISEALEAQGIEYRFVTNESELLAIEIVPSDAHQINRIWKGVAKHHQNLKFIFFPEGANSSRGYYHPSGHFIKISGELLRTLDYEPLSLDTMIHEIYHGIFETQKRMGFYNAYHPKIIVPEGKKGPYSENQESYKDLFSLEELFTWRRGAEMHLSQSTKSAKNGEFISFSYSVRHFEMRMSSLKTFFEYYDNFWPMVKKAQVTEANGQLILKYSGPENIAFEMQMPKAKGGLSLAEQLAKTEEKIGYDRSRAKKLFEIYESVRKTDSIEAKIKILDSF